MKQHFVTFYSPGTFVDEETTKPIKSWHIQTAAKMARSITERYGARPHSFQFSTRERNDADLDSKQTAESGRYYLGGRIETIDDVRARNDPKDRILLLNMESNKWDRIIVNDNSWRSTKPLMPTDTILDVKL